ncbi:MAG: type II toxin-antitoxin system RelE/ParE family toxin [candidate division Zixibacteria bacterium]|nr:type II toxin-antitoxin system RelE/ParE family toxin [candidate division Zixibacteria bacterium]
MYAEENGEVPFLNWFTQLPEKAQDKIVVRIERLRELGHELRRPEADYLRDDIYEVRVKAQTVNYRILYFFHGRQLVILLHGFSKQQAKVPENEIILAIRRRAKFQQAPRRHTHKE